MNNFNQQFATFFFNWNAANVPDMQTNELMTKKY